MTKYIDADALEKNPRFHFPGEIKSEFDYGVKVAREACLDALKYASTADVEPVRHGRKIDCGALTCRCSECGIKNRSVAKYCFECGVKLDVGDE